MSYMPPNIHNECSVCNHTWTKAERIEGAPVDSQYIGDLTFYSWCDCREDIFKNNGENMKDAITTYNERR